MKDYRWAASSLEFRKVLNPILSYVPQNMVRNSSIDLVFNCIKEWCNQCEQSGEVDDDSDDDGESLAQNEDVRLVREVFQGKKVVFVGGVPTAHLIERLKDAFGAQIVWEDYGHGDSLDRFNALMMDSQVACFLIVIKWCSHKHSEDLVQIAKRHNKPCLRLNCQTNPATIAHQMVVQKFVHVKKDDSAESPQQGA